MTTRRTDAEVMDVLRGDDPLSRARTVFSSSCARIEQAGAQRRPAGIVEIRRMEIEAVERIVAALGLEMPERAAP